MAHRQLIAAAVMAAIGGPVLAASQTPAQTQTQPQAQTQAPAQAQTQPQSTASGNVVRSTSSADYSASMQRLLDAAQRLRESIQAMGQQPAGTRRNDAIAAAHRALLDAQQAMMLLPPEIRQGTASDSPNETKAMERLRQAADQLRQSIQAMAQEPVGEGRNAAVRQAHQALLETQTAMVTLPQELRMAQAPTESGSSAKAKPAAAAGASPAKSSDSQPAAASAGNTTTPSGEKMAVARDSASAPAGASQAKSSDSQPAAASAGKSTTPSGEKTAAARDSASAPAGASQVKSSSGAQAAASAEKGASSAGQKTAAQDSSAAGKQAPMAASGQADAPKAEARPASVASRETVRERITFESLDRDNDGYISMAEAAINAESVQLFKERDKDHDYQVSRAEWDAGAKRGVKGANPVQTLK